MHRSYCFALIGSVILALALLSITFPEKEAQASTPASILSDPVNDKCPIMGGDVDKDSPRVMYEGHAIGFCCAGCEPKWSAKPDDEKAAFLAKYVPGSGAGDGSMRLPESPRDTTATTADNPAVKVARAYLAACGSADVQALNALFLSDGKASVLENASDEGTWETYRDHHLVPEMKEMPDFKMVVEMEDVQTYGSTSIVRQVGHFMVTDPNHKELQRKILSAVTYVIVDNAGTPRIAHLHWSSRAAKTTTPAADAPKPADHPHGSGHDHN